MQRYSCNRYTSKRERTRLGAMRFWDNWQSSQKPQSAKTVTDENAQIICWENRWRFSKEPQIPSDPTKVSERIELFFGDNFFEMLCKETNLYYFQNQGKYASSSNVLKWVDVSVAEFKKIFCNNHSLLRRTVKWPKKVALWLINCALFNSFQLYKKLNPATKMKYKEFLL
jgi:hypothetical protein